MRRVKMVSFGINLIFLNGPGDMIIMCGNGALTGLIRGITREVLVKTLRDLTLARIACCAAALGSTISTSCAWRSAPTTIRLLTRTTASVFVVQGMSYLHNLLLSLAQ